MARTNCVTTLESVEDADGKGEELVIRVPIDREYLYRNIQNCNREKNSVTLINGDLVAEAGRRGSVDFYLDIGPYRLQLRGGVNIYVTRPTDAGKKATGYSNADAKAIAEAEAEENAKWAVLAQPLLNPVGDVFRKQGDRILRDTLADLMLAGFTMMPEA